MNALNITRGEWIAKGPNVIAKNGGLTTTIVDDQRPMLSNADRAEALDNARLMAAAPGLLLALSWLVGLHDEKPADRKEQEPLAWAAARAAIKAVMP